MLPLIDVPLTISELTGPGPVISAVTPEDADLTRNAGTGGEQLVSASLSPVACSMTRAIPYQIRCWRSGSAMQLVAIYTRWIAGQDRLIRTSSAWDAV